MKKVFLVAMLLAVSAANASATTHVGFLFPGLVQDERTEVNLPVNLTAVASSAQNGAPEAVFEGNPNWVRVPAGNLKEFESFRYVRYSPWVTTPERNMRHVKFSSELIVDGDSVANQSGEMVVDTAGLAPGLYALKVTSVNDVGKKRIKLNLILLRPSFAYGRATAEDTTLAFIQVVNPTKFLDEYVETSEGSASYSEASDDCRKLAVRCFLEEQMGDWNLTAPGVSHDRLEQMLAAKIKNVPLPLQPVAPVERTEPIVKTEVVNVPPPVEETKGSYIIELVKDGKPFMGKATLYASDSSGTRTFNVYGPSVTMKDARGSVKLYAGTTWVNFTVGSAPTVKVEVK